MTSKTDKRSSYMTSEITDKNYCDLLNYLKSLYEPIIPWHRSLIFKTYHIAKQAYSDTSFKCKDNSYINKRILLAYEAAKYMKADLTDIILVILAPAFYMGMVNEDDFNKVYSYEVKKNLEDFISYTALSGDTLRLIDKPFNEHIFIYLVDKMIKKINSKIKAQLSEKSALLNLYSLANLENKCKEGKLDIPYIISKLNIADILADVGSDISVIIASLLYDIEKKDERLLNIDIENDLEYRVLRCVEAVNLLATSVGYISLNQLCNIAMDSEYIVDALNIKAATCLYELRSIELLPKEMQKKKVNDTMNRSLPILRELKMNYFAEVMSNICWCFSNKDDCSVIEKAYKKLLCQNNNSINNMIETLSNICCYKINDTSVDYNVEIKKELFLPEFLFEQNLLKDGSSPEKCKKNHSDISKESIDLSKVYVIVDEKNNKGSIFDFFAMFIMALNEDKNDIVITAIIYDEEYEKYIIKIENSLLVSLRVIVTMRNSYESERYGTMHLSINSIDDNITVYTNSNAPVKIPKGATGLDFAFHINEELAFSVIGVTIDGKESDPYTVLQDGNVVDIITDANCINNAAFACTSHVSLEWLKHVVTSKARDAIIKRLQDMYEKNKHINKKALKYKVVSNTRVNFLTKVNSQSQLNNKENSSVANSLK